jgi:hypothetical protein
MNSGSAFSCFERTCRKWMPRPSMEVVRPAGLVDAAVEVLEVRLRDGEDEGGDGVIGHGFLLR